MAAVNQCHPHDTQDAWRRSSAPWRVRDTRELRCVCVCVYIFYRHGPCPWMLDLLSPHQIPETITYQLSDPVGRGWSKSVHSSQEA